MRRLLLPLLAIVVLALVPLTACSLPGAGMLRDNGSAGDTRSGNGSGGTRASQAKDRRPRTPTMVVLDASGSMKVQDAPGQRFAAAQKAVVDMTASLRKGHPIGLMTYGTRTGNSEADKPAGCRDVTRVLPVGPLDKSSYDAAVTALRPRGYTPIGTALQRAAAALPTKGKRAIVLISDGVDTCAPPAPCDVAPSLHEAQPDLAISTVGFRVGGDAQAQLECIAEATGGSYLDATSGPVLGSRLAALFDPEAVARSIQPTGYRDVELGMTSAQTRSAAGSRASRSSRAALGKVPAKGRVEVRYVDCTLVFQDGVVVAIRSASKHSVSTVDGTTVGDQVSAVLATYGSSYSLPEPGVVQVPADTVAGTGYEIRYDGPSDAATPAGTVTTITLCRCAPTLGVGMVAFNSTTAVSGARVSPQIWNGHAVVFADIGGSEYYDEGEAIGFVGGYAVYDTRRGAHGYIDYIWLVDPESGRSIASAECFTCEVMVSDNEVVAFNGFDGWIRRYDSRLRQIDQITVDRAPFAHFDGDDDVAGDPPQMFNGLAVAGNSFWVEGADPGTDISSAFESGRIHRLDESGSSVARSAGGLLRTAPGALSQDRSTLIVPSGDGSYGTLDAQTLEPKDEVPQRIGGASQWVSSNGTDLTLVGGSCVDSSDTCGIEGPPGITTWDGTAWHDVGPVGTICAGDLNGERVLALRDIDSPEEDPMAKIIRDAGLTTTVLATVSATGCVVDVPLQVG